VFPKLLLFGCCMQRPSCLDRSLERRKKARTRILSVPLR
jgi:hypothetical protein